jgi:hypothetical protein
MLDAAASRRRVEFCLGFVFFVSFVSFVFFAVNTRCYHDGIHA